MSLFVVGIMAHNNVGSVAQHGVGGMYIGAGELLLRIGCPQLDDVETHDCRGREGGKEGNVGKGGGVSTTSRLWSQHVI